ncbi:carboxymuconolactone decarboxylase family protein, partial [Acinetobacter baumannii]
YEMFAPAAALFKSVFEAEGIDPETRQMIIMRCAKKLRCPYLWQASVLIAKNLGLSDAEIKATECGTSVEGIDKDYVLVCRATDELIDLG